MDIDGDDYIPSSNANAANLISEDKAKSIAFNRAGISASQAKYYKGYCDYDDGRYVYEIEFVSGETKHELEIDATTGSVIKYETDWIYD